MPLDANDMQLISEAVARGGEVWDDPTLTPVKAKIKKYYRDTGGEQCCYCRREMRDEFNMVIDIEHILPKSLFTTFMFELFNLNISCKRCNMRIKKDRVEFVVNPAAIAANARESNQYLMVHPNLDDYHTHIDYLIHIHNTRKMVKYMHKTRKGKFTYDFFELERIEINNLNAAQGINVEGSQLSINLSPELAAEAGTLLDRL